MKHQPARSLGLRRFDPTLLLAFLLPVFAWAPLTYPGYFVFRSGFLPVFNLSDRLAHAGDFGWMPVIGTQYSLLGGEGTLSYLLASLASLFTASSVDAVKLIFALSFVAASVGAWGWARGRLGSGVYALFAATVYVFNPIALHTVYTDGALARTVALALAPWTLWAADAAAFGRRRAALALALLAAAEIWTQAGLGLAFVLVILVYLLVLHRVAHLPLKGFARVITALVAGILIGALGLLPVFLRNGMGAANWPALTLPVLLVPWVAWLAGWLAARLFALLPDAEAASRPALLAALLALALLLVYGDIQPAVSAVSVPDAPFAIFGNNEIALLSVRTEGRPGPNGSVAVEVEWQALRPLDRDYTVFFHVIANKDQRYGQLDTMPLGGKHPTSQWQPGEVVRDRYEATLAPDAPAEGGYRFWLGWYFGETGERLPVRQGAAPAALDKYIIDPG